MNEDTILVVKIDDGRNDKIRVVVEPGDTIIIKY